MPVAKKTGGGSPGEPLARAARRRERVEAFALLDRLEAYAVNARLEDISCMVQRVKFLLRGGIR